MSAYEAIGNVTKVNIFTIKTVMLAIFMYILTSCICYVLIYAYANFLLKISVLKN